MATRSNIGYVDGDKIVRIYHHWDGYPEALGRSLLSRYTTEDQVRDLVAGGDISTLNEPGEPLYYAKRSQWDAGLWGSEDEPWEHVKPQELDLQHGREVTEEWLYLWEGGQWMVSGDDGEFRPLADVLDEMDAAAAEVADAEARQ